MMITCIQTLTQNPTGRRGHSWKRRIEVKAQSILGEEYSHELTSGIALLWRT